MCRVARLSVAGAVARAGDPVAADDDVVIGELEVDRAASAQHQVAFAGDELAGGVIANAPLRV